MAEKVTSSLCFRAFSKLQRAISDWNAADNFNVNWGGGVVKGISFTLQTAIESFLDETADDGREVLPDARSALMRIDELFDAYDTFKRRAAEESPLAPPGGSTELWRAIQNLIALFAQKSNLQKPMPIRDLVDQSVSPLQIAAIYGWTDESGAPDTTKVAEELQSPGKHYDPETWVHPAIAKRQAMVDAEWANRKTARAVVFTPIEELVAKSDWVPPTLDELVAAGAPPAQIAKLCGITVDEAQELLLAAGKEEKREILHPVNSHVAQQEKIAKDEAIQRAKQVGNQTNTKASPKAPVAPPAKSSEVSAADVLANV